jgi:hypothetical protein
MPLGEPAHEVNRVDTSDRIVLLRRGAARTDLLKIAEL